MFKIVIPFMVVAVAFVTMAGSRDGTPQREIQKAIEIRSAGFTQ